MKKGEKHSAEAREKIRKASTGRVYSAEARAKISKARTGAIRGAGHEYVAARNSLFCSYRNKARKRGLTFGLSLDQFVAITKSDCYYCGKPPSKQKRIPGIFGAYCYNGVDRKDNACGYTLENSLPCCWECNERKRAAGHDEFLSWIARVGLRLVEGKVCFEEPCYQFWFEQEKIKVPQIKTLAEKIESLRVKSGPGADSEWYPGNEETIDKVQALIVAHRDEANTFSFAIDQSLIDAAAEKVKDSLSPIEQSLVGLATPLENYGTVAEALEAIAHARAFQIKKWGVNKPDGNGRPAEEWQLLVEAYVAKSQQVYAESDGRTPEGRIRYAKYAAIVANLAFWWLQSTIGQANDDKRQQKSEQQLAHQTGCTFHSAPEASECGGVTERV